MTQPVVVSAVGVTVIGGGSATPDDLQTALTVAPVLVAADGGADRALQMGRVPDWVIGDLDSITPDARARIPNSRICHVLEQDSTDFVKCLSRIDSPFVMAVGFAGLRLDHTLSTLTTMVTTPYPRVILLTPDDVVFALPQDLSLSLAKGTRVSLYPMGPARGVSTGLEWPVEGIEFSPGGRVGTSNRATGTVRLRMEGKMLLILPRDTLNIALAALELVG